MNGYFIIEIFAKRLFDDKCIDFELDFTTYIEFAGKRNECSGYKTVNCE